MAFECITFVSSNGNNNYSLTKKLTTMITTYNIQGKTDTTYVSRMKCTEVNNSVKEEKTYNVELVKGVTLFVGCVMLVIGLTILINL